MARHHHFRVRLIDPIGSGGTGTVWRAWDSVDRRYVAAKVADVEQPGASTRIDHAHVLTPHEQLDEGERHLALMLLVHGGTTDQLLGRYGALPSDYVAVLLDQLLLALEALHGAGLVHRDVKPANLLLEPTGRHRPHLFLGDLGVVAPIGRPPATTAGTAGYVAPEVGPRLPPEPRHDLYAAGVTTAELLTGRLPRHRDDLPRSPLRALLRDLVDPDPDRRPATARQARERLHAVGVPAGTPWRARRHPPEVPDRLRRLTLLERIRIQGAQAAR